MDELETRQVVAAALKLKVPREVVRRAQAGASAALVEAGFELRRQSDYERLELPHCLAARQEAELFDPATGHALELRTTLSVGTHPIRPGYGQLGVSLHSVRVDPRTLAVTRTRLSERQLQPSMSLEGPVTGQELEQALVRTWQGLLEGPERSDFVALGHLVAGQFDHVLTP